MREKVEVQQLALQWRSMEERREIEQLGGLN